MSNIILLSKSSFSFNRCWVFLRHNGTHKLQMSGVEAVFDGSIVRTEIVANYSFITLTDAEHDLMFERLMIGDSFQKLAQFYSLCVRIKTAKNISLELLIVSNLRSLLNLRRFVNQDEVGNSVEEFFASEEKNWYLLGIKL